MKLQTRDGESLTGGVIVTTPEDAKRLSDTLTKLLGLNVDGLSVQFGDVTVIMQAGNGSMPEAPERIRTAPSTGRKKRVEKSYGSPTGYGIGMNPSKVKGITLREDYHLPARLVGSKALVIRRICGHLGYTVDAFARTMGVSPSGVSYWLGGKGMNAPNWHRIEDMYDADVPMNSPWRSYMPSKEELEQSRAGGKDEDRFNNEHKLSEKLG